MVSNTITVDQMVAKIGEESDPLKLQTLKAMFSQEVEVCTTLLQIITNPQDEQAIDHLVMLNFAQMDHLTVGQLRAIVANSPHVDQETLRSWLFDGLGGFKYKEQIVKGTTQLITDPEARVTDVKRLLDAVDFRIVEVATAHANSGAIARV